MDLVPGIRPEVLARLRVEDRPGPQPFGWPQLPAGVMPRKAFLAMDAAVAPGFAYLNTAFGAGMGFIGYPFLSELVQRAEYRAMSERVAYEMTRKWIKLRSNSDQDKTEEIRAIEKKLAELRVRQHFRQAATYDGFFGRAQLYVSIDGARRDDKELAKPLLESRFKIPRGSLKGFKLIEPIVTFPFEYNSIDPLADDYYKPRSWFVMGRKVHDSRLLTFAARPVPDILKPAYNFGGLSMSQLAMETVENWLKTRANVNRMISSYSTSGIKRNMTDVLNGGEGEGFIDRMELFARCRDNFGVMALDKENEDFFQFNAPISNLDKLQAQAQEHMAAISHTPLIILTGISPSGLNASSEGEIRVYYDYVHDLQEVLFREQLEKVIRLIQLSEFGVIDDSITFEFEPLWQADVEKLARIRKADADAGVELIAAGVISAQEHREKMAKDPDSGYEGLDVDAEVPQPDPELVAGKDPLLAKTEGIEKPAGVAA